MTNKQEKLLKAGIVIFILWWASLLFIQVGKAHDMELAQVEIALQDAEHRAEEYRWELLETRQEFYIIQDRMNQMQAHEDAANYTEDADND